MRTISRGALFLLVVAATGLASSPVALAGTATFTGTVEAVNSTQITVKASQHSRRFLIGDDFEGVWTSKGDKKKTLDDVKPGMSVQVTYFNGAVAHTEHVKKITIVNGFKLNIDLSNTPAPAAGSAAP